jgi:uncharacterized protein (DUF2147 family)
LISRIRAPKRSLKKCLREKVMTLGSKTSAAFAALALMLLGSTGAHADPSGIWQRSTGESRVRISSCGSNYCGSIVWLKDPSGPAKIGQRVFFDMAESGANKWSGKAFNPEDGKTYAGTMTLNGRSLTTAGCVLGGIICRSVNWSKAN